MILPNPNGLSMLVILVLFAFNTKANAKPRFVYLQTRQSQSKTGSVSAKLKRRLSSDELSCTVLTVAMRPDPDHHIRHREIEQFLCRAHDVTLTLVGDVASFLGEGYDRDPGPIITFNSDVVSADGAIDVDAGGVSLNDSFSNIITSRGSPPAHKKNGRHKSIVIRVVDSTGASPDASESDLHRYFFRRENESPSAVRCFLLKLSSVNTYIYICTYIISYVCFFCLLLYTLPTTMHILG